MAENPICSTHEHKYKECESEAMSQHIGPRATWSVSAQGAFHVEYNKVRKLDPCKTTLRVQAMSGQHKNQKA